MNSYDDAIDLSGFRPGTTPSSDELGTLMQICNQTYTAITKYDSEGQDGSASSPSLSPAVNSNLTQLSEIELKTCKKFMVLSDSNRNSVLEASEFVSFISRMTTTQDLSGYELSVLDVSIQAIYQGKSSEVQGIVIDGSKPGQQATPTQENFFRTLCTDVNSAIKKLRSKRFKYQGTNYTK